LGNPTVLVNQPNFDATWNALFGDKLKPSPVPGIYASAKAEYSALAAKLAANTQSAIEEYQAVLAQNPNILLAPTLVVDWSAFQSAVAVLNAITPKQSALNNYLAALDSWFAQNNGSETPSPLPAAPVI